MNLIRTILMRGGMAKGNWTRVSQKLPPEDSIVLVYGTFRSHGQESWFLNVAEFYKGRFEFPERWPNSEDVTHWSWLPDPPEDEDEEEEKEE